MAHTIVIFGASGDLTSRKLIPALYELHRKRRMPERTRIVGSSRTAFSHQAWRDRLAESTAKYLGVRFDRQIWEDFASSIFYHAGDVTQPDDVASLGRVWTKSNGRRGHAPVLSVHSARILRAGRVEPGSRPA
jgi:glucose-6-phosphate 1-dehydrogenase